MKPDPFEVLGVSPRAGWEEIRRAYLRRVKDCHPDRGGDPERYLALQEAYERLREAYQARRRVQVVRERPGRGDYFLSFIELSIREVALGAERWVKVPDELVPCEYCGGGGLDPRGKKKVCEWCRGEGLLAESGGVYRHICPRCRGEGEIWLTPCPRCRGKGQIRGEKEVLVTIPPGVREGDFLFLPRSPDGPALDVFLEVFVQKDDRWFLEGEDLVCRVPVPFWKAALGGRVRVELLEGAEEIEIPRGLPSGARLVLNQRGPFHPDGRRGNLVLQFEIWFPDEYPPQALSLLHEFYKIMEGCHGGATRSQ
ncbi:DnaJ C-terminal domain-containing protein [Thermosulfurimonas sp. F29]|uniref:DnaJ C-terminal domain-containing protein n=1 Tax=Thermosulfurimonas sp. F29 TaxID=2867247 RepID=UPI001C83FE28|nr:DnaJ C-terminal domain-containing protein [Thermosulfurimonas sp. F29]MBX6423589.1 DnaJ domain-containing protein [Thermosulfurimonas sp. F29]